MVSLLPPGLPGPRLHGLPVTPCLPKPTVSLVFLLLPVPLVSLVPKSPCNPLVSLLTLISLPHPLPLRLPGLDTLVCVSYLYLVI